MDTEKSYLQTLKDMKRSDLVKLANDGFGLLIADNLDKETIAQLIFDIDQETKNKAADMNKVSTKMVIDDDDRAIRVQFIPQEFPNADYEFNFDSGRGIKAKGTKAKKIARTGKTQLERMPHYHLYPMQEYMLPMSVIRHLEKLTYQDNAPVYDPATGQISGNMPIIKPRFILRRIMSEEQERELGVSNLE